MTDYTKGPWQTVMVGDSNPKAAIATEDMVSVLTIAWEDETPFAAVFEDADANLMAAAPEMLEALKAAVSQVHLTNSIEPMSPNVKMVFDQCCNAIAKAEGRSK